MSYDKKLGRTLIFAKKGIKADVSEDGKK